jgi:hypothetical protein
MFYLNNLKVMFSDIFNLLIEIGLVHWIMDNGFKHSKGLYLNVYAFSTEDVNRLINTLENKFGLKCSIYLKGNKPSPDTRTFGSAPSVQEFIFRLNL